MKPSSVPVLPSGRAAPLCSSRGDCSKDVRSIFGGSTSTPAILFCSLGVAAAFTFFALYAPRNPFQFYSYAALRNGGSKRSCELFDGRWVPDPNRSPYTNWSCRTIPSSKNCFMQGRRDSDFVSWRWKPHGCELPRFDPKGFLEMVRGKKLGFVGDSVARNHMESLLCLLSQEETPTDVYKDSEDRFRTWHFPHHNFTLMILWTKFLVPGEERVINGSNSGVFDLHLDKVDPKWAPKLPLLNYAIISDSHWFFRKVYLYNASSLIGCVYCNEPNVTSLDLALAVRMAFRAALSQINGCEGCKGLVTLVRTISPAHFENGTWNTGGSCPRTSPLGEGEAKVGETELEIRNAQVEEMEKARRGGGGETGTRFGVLDVTRAMSMRADGHPGAYWGNKWMKGYNDCVHWCLPGPIDAWNDFMMAVLGREAGLGLPD